MLTAEAPPEFSFCVENKYFEWISLCNLCVRRVSVLAYSINRTPEFNWRWFNRLDLQLGSPQSHKAHKGCAESDSNHHPSTWSAPSAILVRHLNHFYAK